jgi:hypothetical protein
VLLNPEPTLTTHEDIAVHQQNEEADARNHQRAGSVSGAIATMRQMSPNIAAAMSHDPLPAGCSSPRRPCGETGLKSLSRESTFRRLLIR